MLVIIPHILCLSTQDITLLIIISLERTNEEYKTETKAVYNCKWW